MYDKSDPRAGLAPVASGAPVWTTYSPADYSRFYEMAPQESGSWGRTWMTRGQNAIVAYSDVEAGARAEARRRYIVVADGVSATSARAYRPVSRTAVRRARTGVHRSTAKLVVMPAPSRLSAAALRIIGSGSRPARARGLR